jgi:hypothetical protein
MCLWYENDDGEIIAKRCSKCEEIKLLDSFALSKKGLGGRRHECCVCKAAYRKITREQDAETSRKWREENKEHKLNSDREWRDKNREKRAEADRKWYQSNPDKVVLKEQRRRARKAMLPDDFTVKQMFETMSIFGNGCALTNQEDEIQWDHVIPLATGHGGTTFGNMIPLCAGLNKSKSDANIFEWFESNKKRKKLSRKRFDRLIKWLAEVNGMTVEEYRAYVYECHANPNEIDDANIR